MWGSTTTLLLNNGGLTIVNKTFFEWGKQVMDTIRHNFNIGILELDPKHAFETAKKSILSEKLLKARFMTIYHHEKLCSKTVAAEVYTSILTKNNPCQVCSCFPILEGTNCRKNGNVALCT